MGLIATNLLGAVADDHEGYIPDETATQLRANCGCGWVGDQVWNNDRANGRYPSEALASRVLDEWRDHVRAIAAAEPAPDPTAIARQVAENMHALVDATRPGAAHTVYPAELYRSLLAMHTAIEALPRLFDNSTEVLRRHQTGGRLYSDHGTPAADLADFTSALDQARTGLTKVSSGLDAATDVARNLGYKSDEED